jgi:hypothetical protein
MDLFKNVRPLLVMNKFIADLTMYFHFRCYGFDLNVGLLKVLNHLIALYSFCAAV